MEIEGTNARLKNSKDQYIQKSGSNLILAQDARSPDKITSDRTPNLSLQEFTMIKNKNSYILTPSTNQKQAIAINEGEVVIAFYRDRNDAGIAKKSFIIDI